MISAATLRHDAFKAPAPTRALFPEFPPVDWADGDTVLNATNLFGRTPTAQRAGLTALRLKQQLQKGLP